MVLRAGDADLEPPLPSTRPARTLIDLAGVLPPSDLRRAVDDAIHRKLVTPDHLLRRIVAVGPRGRPGVVALRRVLTEKDPTESEFERRLLRILRSAGLPEPALQFDVVLGGGCTRRLDFAYPERRLAIEADSYRHHGGPAGWARDHVRNRDLVAAGWRVLPATWDDLADPARLLAAVHRALNALPHPA
jgi:very-short-patch-repair endonuclease